MTCGSECHPQAAEGGLLTKGSEQTLRSSSAVVEDDPFQQLLFEFSNAASKGLSAAEILRVFCRSTRNYFQVSGAYVWYFSPPDQLVGAEADGWMADRFREARMKASDSAVAQDAILKKRTVFVNSLNTARYPMAAQYSAQS